MTHSQLPFTADLHALETLVPTLDDLAGTETEVEGRTAGVGVKLLAVHELADVSHAESLALLGDGSVSDLEVLDDQSAGQGLLLAALLLGLLGSLLLLLDRLRGFGLLLLGSLFSLLLGGVRGGSLLLSGGRGGSLGVGLLRLGLSLLVSNLLGSGG